MIANLQRLAYLSFDVVPAPKGAATHIEAFAKSLAASFGGVELVTVSEGEAATPRMERWDGVFQQEFPALGASLIDRVLCFRRFVSLWLGSRRFEAIQFRSIFEGLPLRSMAGGSALIFEVNGLPSIELKYRYPGVEDDRELMRKIVAQEDACFDMAHRIVTPSGVTANYLIGSRGVSAAKVRVIPNGVDLELFRPLERERGERSEMRLLYFGTFAAWQGIELAVRALAQVCSVYAATLTIVGMGNSEQRARLSSLAEKLGVGKRLEVLAPMAQAELAELVRASDAVVAPLAWNDRNVVQGCCPLKILEAMGSGVPVITSDLPVVRELGCDGVHFLLVKAGSVEQIAEAVVRLRGDEQLGLEIGVAAREQVVRRFSWERAGMALTEVYREMGIGRAWSPGAGVDAHPARIC